MESGKQKHDTRLLCLGNDLLADDSFGILAAKELRKCMPDNVDVVDTIEFGFSLMDYLFDVRRLVVIDSVQTGKEAPGTIYRLKEGDMDNIPGSSPHYVGLFESLALGKKLEMNVAEEVEIIAVETADCQTLGGDVHPSVRDAVPKVVKIVEELIH